MTTDRKNQFDITGGPSREDLFDGLRLRHEYRPVLFCIFVDANQKTNSLSPGFHNKNLQVNSIAVEDGSGHKWLIELHDQDETFGSTKLRGYFNTATRKGWVEPITNKYVDDSSRGVNLDELQEEAQKLLGLLANRQPGLMSWNGFMRERLKSLNSLISKALGL